MTIIKFIYFCNNLQVFCIQLPYKLYTDFIIKLVSKKHTELSKNEAFTNRRQPETD
jgi:hypothetical protein